MRLRATFLLLCAAAGANAAAKLKVIWQPASDWIAMAREGEPGKVFASGTLLVTVEAGTLPVQTARFVDTNGAEFPCKIDAQPGGAVGAISPLKLTVPLPADGRSRQGYLELTTAAGDPVTVSVRIQQGEAARVAEVLGYGAIGGAGVIAAAVLWVLVFRRGEFNAELGQASWDFGSLATNTTVAAAVLAAMLGLPAAAGWTKFEWGRNYAVIAAMAATLAAAATPLYNLLRKGTKAADGTVKYTGFAPVFLAAVLFIGTGLAIQVYAAWLAITDLWEKAILTEGVRIAAHGVVVLLAGALAWYLSSSTVETLAPQAGPAGAAPPAKAQAFRMP